MARFSFSTAWNADAHRDGKGLVDEIKALGFNKIELNFSLTKNIVNDIRGLVLNKKIIVTSVHNFCPVPDQLQREKVFPDHYNLASQDKSIRKKGVELAKLTIDTAKSLSAHAVVVHLGRVEVDDRTRELALNSNDKKNYLKIRDLMKFERSQKEKAHFKAALESLKELSDYARMRNIRLGIENRFYYREIPIIEEFDLIMKRFSGDDTVFYWHDVGHAKVFENLGLVKEDEYLKLMKDRVLGMHIHDVNGIDDHRPPGEGSVDFYRLKKYIKDDTLLVLEIHKNSKAADIIKAKKYIEGVFFKKVS